MCPTQKMSTAFEKGVWGGVLCFISKSTTCDSKPAPLFISIVKVTRT